MSSFDDYTLTDGQARGVAWLAAKEDSEDDTEPLVLYLDEQGYEWDWETITSYPACWYCNGPLTVTLVGDVPRECAPHIGKWIERGHR